MTVPTRGEIYDQLLHHIRMAEEHAATMAHLHNTEGTKDKAMVKGWLNISEMFRRVAIHVTHMAQGRLQ